MMEKFYVQSGNVSLILLGKDAEHAAQCAVYRTIDEYFPIDDIEIYLLNRGSIECVLSGLAEMDPWIEVSQIGFGRSDAGRFARDELFRKLKGQSTEIDELSNSQVH